MTDPEHTDPVEVTQADWDAAFAFERMVGGADTSLLSTCFARHRTAAEAAFRAREARLREALTKARKIIRDVEDYMARPNRGDWESECALCMGELFDDDREAIAAIDAALTASEVDEVL